MLGKFRSLAVVGGGKGIRRLHSLPSYYGLLAALWCALPCLLVVAIWSGFQDRIITMLVQQTVVLPGQQDGVQFGLFMNDVRNLISGAVPAESVSGAAQAAAAEFLRLKNIAALALTGLVLALGVVALWWCERAFRRSCGRATSWSRSARRRC
jgi:phosphate transport system permease protein